MALTYSEFDTTAQNLLHDLRNAVIASADWTKISPTAIVLTTSANAAAGGTVLTFTATGSSGWTIGQLIRIGESGAADAEYRSITAITGTTITVAALTFLHNTGTNVYNGNEVLKATTTRGADMIVDIHGALMSTFQTTFTVWRAHTGTVGTDSLNRFMYWRPSAGALTNPLHCVVSASKEHLFISIEGPRAYETNPVSTTAGSDRQYFFINDLVPYHVGDTTPVVVTGGGQAIGTATANMTSSRSFEVYQSRNYANTSSWAPAKLFTLAFQGAGASVGVNGQHQTTGDGKYYLSPYVVLGDQSGYRGRLASFFNAGMNYADHTDFVSPPTNAVVTYGAKNYKLLQVSKSDGNISVWGPFGGTDNSATTTYHRSPIVAVQTT